MQSQEIVVTKLIEQLQIYLEDLRAGRPMNRRVAQQLPELIPDLRTAVADRLVAIGILHEDERHWV